MSLAKIVVTGRVVRAPEKRFTPNTNVAVTEFAIAVESAPRPDGSTESNTIKVLAWRDLAERCAQGLQKGDLVAVDGRLQINSYTTSDGQRRRDPEIEAVAVENLTQTLDSPSSGVSAGQVERPVAKTGSKPAKGGQDDLDALFASEDEIPF